MPELHPAIFHYIQLVVLRLKKIKYLRNNRTLEYKSLRKKNLRKNRTLEYKSLTKKKCGVTAHDKSLSEMVKYLLLGKNAKCKEPLKKQKRKRKKTDAQKISKIHIKK